MRWKQAKRRSNLGAVALRECPEVTVSRRYSGFNSDEKQAAGEQNYTDPN